MVLRQSFTESQEEDLKYKHLLEMAPDAVFVADVESGIILDTNKSAAKLLGIPVDEIIGMHQSQLHPPEEAERYKKIFQDHIDKGTAVFSDDIYVCRKDGHKIPVQINTAVTQIGSKNIIYGIFRDITELKHLMEDLKASETRFKRLADATFEAIVIQQGGSIIDVNQQYLDLFGYTLEEVKAIPSSQMIAPQSRELVEEKTASGYQGIYEAFGRKKDGTIFPVEIQVKETVLDGQPIRIGAIRDMTQLKEAEKQIVDLAKFPGEDPNPVFRVSNDGVVMYANAAGEELLSKWASEQGKPIPTDWKQVIEDVFSSRCPTTFEVENEGKIFSFFAVPILQESYVNLYGSDITVQNQLQQELAASERHYRELYDNSHLALLRTALDGTLLDCNRTCLALFGYDINDDKEKYLNKVCVADYYVNPARRQEFIDTLMRDKRVQRFEAELKRPDGTPFWVSMCAEIFPGAGYIEGVMSDITATKHLTKTEKKVLDQLMRGKSNKEIARELRRSVRTIEDHRSHIMQKLGVDNLVDLTQKALNLNNHYTEE